MHRAIKKTKDGKKRRAGKMRSVGDEVRERRGLHAHTLKLGWYFFYVGTDRYSTR